MKKKSIHRKHGIKRWKRPILTVLKRSNNPGEGVLLTCKKEGGAGGTPDEWNYYCSDSYAGVPPCVSCVEDPSS